MTDAADQPSSSVVRPLVTTRPPSLSLDITDQSSPKSEDQVKKWS